MFEGKSRNVWKLGGGAHADVLRSFAIAQDDMTGKGRLVGWSVGQFLCTPLSFRGLVNEEKCMYSIYPMEKKKI